jgi:hypothetical protein
MRRSSSTRPEAHNSPMASATPPHPSARRRPAAARGAGSSPSAAAPKAGRRPAHGHRPGPHTDACAWSPSKPNTTMAPEGRRRISSAPGTVRATRSTSVATGSPGSAVGPARPAAPGRTPAVRQSCPAPRQAPSSQAQPAVEGLPVHACPLLQLEAHDWMYCLPACGLPAWLADSGTRTSDGLSRMFSTAASMRIS